MSDSVNVRIKVAASDLRRVEKLAGKREPQAWPNDRTSPVNLVLRELLERGIKRSQMLLPEDEFVTACLRLSPKLTASLQERAEDADMIFSKYCAAVIATELAK